MTNAANIVSITGRLTREPVFFDNKDGSKKVKATLAVQDNFKSGPDKKRQSQFIPVEQFLSAQIGQGAWANVTKGSMVQCLCHLESNTYEKDGETIYGGVLVVVDSVNYLETRAETEARRAANAAKGAPAGATPAAAETAAAGNVAGAADMPFGN